MENIRSYILSVITAAIIVSAVKSILGDKGSMGALVRLIGGLFLTFTLLSPVVRLDFSGIADSLEEYLIQGQALAVSGEVMGQAEYRKLVKQQTEAYIQDKANKLGLSLQVEVTLGEDDPVPEEVTLRGAVSPGMKGKLQQVLLEELGIPKERQLWIW